MKGSRERQPRPSAIIISPSCDAADQASTRFKSISEVAIKPATSAVVAPIQNRTFSAIGVASNREYSRKTRNTPAATMVAE